MAIKPMLFNTEMVRAILSGQKTCTRRVVKPQPLVTPTHIEWRGYEANQFESQFTGFDDMLLSRLIVDGKTPCKPCDILYVRETWTAYSRTYGEQPWIIYKADGDPPKKVKWHPSTHMPREAARIFLRVTNVRVERLQAITTVGLQAEGILPAGYLSQFATMTSDCFERWKDLWDSTIKLADRDRYGWAANPWVWVIEFERISKEAARGGDAT